MQLRTSGLFHEPQERGIYWSSFMIRCFLGLSAWLITQYMDLSLVEDAMLYEEQGAVIASEWLAGGSSPTLDLWRETGRQAWSMVFLLAVSSYLLGGLRILPLVIILFNLITSWTPVFTYRIGRQLGMSFDGIMTATRLVMLSPVFAFWAGALYKEGIILLLLNMITYHALLLQVSTRLRSVIILGASLSLLTGFRFYLPGLLIPGIAFSLLWGRRMNSPIRSEQNAAPGSIFLRQSVVLAFLVGILVVAGLNAQLSRILPYDTEGLLGAVQVSRNDLSSTSSGYFSDTEISTPAAALRFLPLGIAYFLTVPFPWELGSLRQNLVIPEMIFWLSLYPSIFLGMKLGLRRNVQGTVLLLSMTLPMICFYGLFVGNAGTAYRLRSQVWVFWALFAGWYRQEKRLRRVKETPLASDASPAALDPRIGSNLRSPPIDR